MDWLERMNGAITYIEHNLTEEIDLEKVAQIACCSSYHFQRMFSFIAGIPLSEYIRRRRLTKAGFDLLNTDLKVIDIALKYGYSSPDSFTRAFQNLHHVTPTLARQTGVELKAYPKISFQITIKGDIELNYRIEEKSSFKVFGIEKEVSVINGKCFKEIPDFWLELEANGSLKKMNELVGDDRLLNASMYGHDPKRGTFKYMICANLPEHVEIPNEYLTLEVNEFTWAIFRSEEHTVEQTTDIIQDIWKRIFAEWFPSSSYEHADGPEFEMYYKAGNNKFIVEAWVPVAKK